MNSALLALGAALVVFSIAGCQGEGRAPAPQSDAASRPRDADPPPTEPAPEPEKLTAFETGRATTDYDLSGASRLSLRNLFGDVELAPGGPQVAVESAVYARGIDLADARERASALSVSSQRDPEVGLEVEVEGEVNVADFRVDLIVSAPPDIEATIHVKPGAVTIFDWAAPVEVHGASGDIAIRGIDGSVTVDSTSGAIEVANVGQGVTARASSGSLVLQHVRGPIIARNMSGTIHLADAGSDKIIVSTNTGEIDARPGGAFSGDLHARAGDGDITVALSRGANCRVRTATRDGEITNSLPLQDMTLQGRNISGRLGKGDGLVDVATGDGDIALVIDE
jgi:DUF4097 and DUF4098 domain-containing protein YvlB